MKVILILFFSGLGHSVFCQNRFDVVIDEIMADPAPSVGLPGNEWVELKNTSNLTVNLQQWRLADENGQSGAFPFFLLQPDSFVIICSNTAAIAMSVYGRTISVSTFPSLNNTGEEIYLKSPSGQVIHAVRYKVDWYRNELKSQGGWSLEMIDPLNPCGGSFNWKGSTAVNGGTPGLINSVNALNPDEEPPLLMTAICLDSIQLMIEFNEPLDSLSASRASSYSINNGISVVLARPVGPLFDKVRLQLSSPFITEKIYEISVNGIRDCKGNLIMGDNILKTGLPSDALQGDWVINEILFDPPSNGYDFVEFYNNSKKVLDASRLFLATRDATNTLTSIYPLSNEPHYVLPGEHFALTENTERIQLYYFVKEPSQLKNISSLPSFPDDEGKVVALNMQGELIDELHYYKEWHFALLANTEGISLERINPSGNSNNKSNWHSAASTAGYATPGYKNSQFNSWNDTSALVKIDPPVFSPDNDGRDDIVVINYYIREQGYVANLTVYDASGRPVRKLVSNDLLGTRGQWTWDGLDDSGGPLPVGIYIVLTDLFNLQGKKLRKKNTIVLARKLR